MSSDQSGPATGKGTQKNLLASRRLAICDIRIWTESPDRLAAQANVTYALPG